ncbi:MULTISPECIES: DUF6951 family protein [Oscillospiraceae]|jgi:hypothetical protein|uniref:Uncharacterized protein n=1 Tax=Lawsonibacter faecis TaxID=2763052 RepID=A0A8J6JKN7_9FIRM|nr:MULTISPECIES: hypothetical protein [Oscillospiraceae]MTQ97073.1 hypothetical protein [Pseudoflavonifractor sp. BIOML-A16]MTR06105.1 hypothetical protein [Pseudoflavonifractor sp. BIOML-A15]MTR33704.1 hypothetical protein [Pseudoflavonifractor sp. BIOML-A14]MTR72797.1 hypothetical protein [Pseudoflavonifractor sp. BIOML-A18]MTS63302.1 hypothetical protein [Pseudoflavonifractor sp. BIOML-A5]MTS70889.1 hypothetical protein [Pseudoflavonifractor sp. BIOML-A8]MTS90310.1 hypothetical protein [P
MKKLLVNPGICGFKTLVEASADKETGDVTVKVASGCPAVQKMMDEVGDTFDSYALCLTPPGAGPLYEYAAAHFPAHAACPVISGIIKCAEAESVLALPAEVSFTFQE